MANLNKKRMLSNLFGEFLLEHPFPVPSRKDRKVEIFPKTTSCLPVYF